MVIEEDDTKLEDESVWDTHYHIHPENRPYPTFLPTDATLITFCHIHLLFPQSLHSSVNYHLTTDCIPCHRDYLLPPQLSLEAVQLKASRQGKARQSTPPSSARTMHCTGPTHTRPVLDKLV